VITVRMNDLAADSLGMLGHLAGAGALGELVPGLRERVAEGIVRRGEVVVFRRDVGADRRVTPGQLDLTGWECNTSSFHLEDVVPVEVTVLDSGQPVISEDDQRCLLVQGLGFAVQIGRLVRALDEPVALRCIVSANSTNGTFRFHRIRPGESWGLPDLDTYLSEKLIEVDVGPMSPGATAD
jgi:hypothetical protein